MRWPWVSRDASDLAQRAATFAHEEAVAAVERANELKDALVVERARYDALFERYDALKVTGARPPLEVAEISPVGEAIDAKVRQFGNSTRLRRILQSFATRERLRGMDSDAIIARVMDWSSKADEESA